MKKSSCHIEFEPVGRRGNCPAGMTVLDYARQLGVDLVNICGGTGACGTCVVRILNGRVSPPDDSETAVLTNEKIQKGFRLACRTVPQGNVKIEIPVQSLATPQRTQVECDEVFVDAKPLVETFSVSLSPVSAGDPVSDEERLLRGLRQQYHITDARMDLPVLRELPDHIRQYNREVRIALRERKIVGFLDKSAAPLGFAVDLGTTKIAGYLVDLTSGKTLGAFGVMNPQISYGEDLIARLVHAMKSSAEAGQLQSVVIKTLNQMIMELCRKAEVASDQIVDAVIVGNTAMHHLVLRLPVKSLSRAPYVPAIQSALDVKATELGLAMAPGAVVHFFPNIAGYVGGDHVAMLLAAGVRNLKGVVLALDIGTNTEVCLLHNGCLTSLSCASGPAFEGAHITHGMRAADGAIERVRLTGNQCRFQTIGGKPPAGLCGSGIIDMMAELYRIGVLEKNGRMRDHPRIRTRDGLKEFVLAEADEYGKGCPEITFTQKDVREVQLAKGAVRTGIQVLLENCGIAGEQIDQLIIAGAFGSYIDPKCSMDINMIPSIPLDRIRQIGNAAGMGSRLALISGKKRKEASILADQVRYIELASFPEFFRIFADSMDL